MFSSSHFFLPQWVGTPFLITMGDCERTRKKKRKEEGGEKTGDLCCEVPEKESLNGSRLQTHNSGHIKQPQEDTGKLCTFPAKTVRLFPPLIFFIVYLNRNMKWDLQRESRLKTAIEQDLHFNPCP